MENITTRLLAALRSHLETHPIDFRGDADSMIDFLFNNYIEYVPISTMRETESYRPERPGAGSEGGGGAGRP